MLFQLSNLKLRMQQVQIEVPSATASDVACAALDEAGRASIHGGNTLQPYAHRLPSRQKQSETHMFEADMLNPWMHLYGNATT